MRIQLNRLKSHAECPAYGKFLSAVELPPKHIRNHAIESVIKKAYIQATETGYRTDWRRIVGWVDSIVFEGTDVADNVQFLANKTLSEAVLSTVQKWYNAFYLQENYITYVDVPMEVAISSSIVEATVPIIQVAEVPRVTIFNELGIELLQLYNDLTARGLAWMVSSELDSEKIQVRSLGIGTKGGIDVQHLSLEKDANQRTERVLQQLVHGVSEGISYPSRTQKCTTCPFYRRCNL